jgi:hypothetical protein
MHYEGADHYSDDIECTDWQQYDIEARHPDVVFTFAPYDMNNHVTSVHPVFYCERLRGLTDMLVYVPYFIISGDMPEHFCTVAGCVYANKVVVQSEMIRDTYIRVFKEAYGNRFGKPEEKFVALGSAKFDKILSTKREDCALPAAWAKLTSSKKIIFYNTAISAALQDSERYLKKLRSVLNLFRSRNDVVLWWRPHPLLGATFESMRRRLTVEYRDIVAGYKREGWGIYDDTSDLHRAIAWTDAYYGDLGSVGRLYGISGKLICLVSYGDESNESNRKNASAYMKKVMGRAGYKTFGYFIFQEKFVAIPAFLDFVTGTDVAEYADFSQKQIMFCNRELSMNAGSSGKEIFRFVKRAMT